MSVRVPDLPHSVEAEQGVLSSMMVGGDRVIANVVQIIGETVGDWFYVPSNRKMYDGLVDWWHAGQPFELNMFTKAMIDANRITDMGGPGHVTSVYLYVPTAANLQMYVDGLIEKRWLRYVVRTSRDLLKTAQTQQNDVQGILRVAEEGLGAIVARATAARKQRTIHEVVTDVIHNLSDREKVLGISTGYEKLDELVGGLAPTAKIVLGGATSGGKSAFAQCLINSLAVDRGVPTALFTYEMSAEEAVQRLIQIRSGVPTRSVADGTADMLEIDRYNRAATEIAAAPLWPIEDQLDIAGIRARCMQLKPRLAVLDYLQIIPEKWRQNEGTTERLDRMSNATKQIAQQLKMTVVELTQLTVNDKTGKITTRFSSGITNDANQLWILEGEDDETKATIQKQLTVAKQRDGARAQVPFNFHRTTTTFRERK